MLFCEAHKRTVISKWSGKAKLSYDVIDATTPLAKRSFGLLNSSPPPQRFLNFRLERRAIFSHTDGIMKNLSGAVKFVVLPALAIMSILAFRALADKPTE